MIKNYLGNKKGAATTDIFVWMILSFVLVITVVMFVFIADKTMENLLENAPMIQKALPEGENATIIIESTFGAVPRAYDPLKWITVMLIVGMAISIILSGYLVTVNKVWFVAYFFIMIIAIIISVPMSNTYEQIYQDPTLASTFSGFWGQNFIFLNLPIWVTVIGFLAAIVMFVNMIRVERGTYQ